MATQTWILGRIGAWFDTSNWTSGVVPDVSDTVIVPGGMPEIENRTIAGEAITLGGSSSGADITLVADTTVFEPVINQMSGKIVYDQSLTVTGGDPSSSVSGTLLSKGVTKFEGQIIVSAVGGTFTIDSENSGGTSGNFTFVNTASDTFVLVSQESALHFEGAQVTSAGVIEVEGSADIASSVGFGGDGIVALENGGQLSVEGTIGASVRIVFADGNGGLTMANPSGFDGTLGFTAVGGNQIDVTALRAQSETVHDDVLRLFAGPNGTGTELAHFNVQMVDQESLNPTGGHLTSADFRVASNGNGGTLLSYTPQGPTYLQASLPTPVVATAGTMVSLQTILMQSFGTATPSPYGITLLPTTAESNTPTDQKYWVTPNVPPATSVPPQWYVNGVAYTSDYTVQPGDDVQLLVGNNINDPAQIRVQVTPLGTGTSAEFVTYDIWSVDPNVAALVQAAGAQAGAPTPSDVIASAQSWNTVFGNLPNTNLCNWIADNVAAAAGATMPFPNALLDPSLNVSGGFWRAVYTSAGPAPQQDWYPLVQPGDIVRMQWFKPESPQDISGHTTTVLGAVNPDGTISVYDNIDHVNGVETIGIHDATYWPLTGPASITIYRLDPDQQYLTQGTSLAEVIQGSVYNNLIQPGGGADIISGGPGHNEIQDTTAHLNGITVTDFKFGDAFDFTDLNPAQATVAFAGTTLQVFMGGAAVATISLPTLPATGTFVLTPDGSGGSLVELDPSAAPWTFLAAGDFNGDGVTDLIWQDPTTGASIEWLMSRNGGVGSMPATPPVQGWTLVATGDFNHDGITDLMWQNSATGATSEWLMSASGGLGSNPATPPVAGWSLITSGDFNGDGITDLMWQNATTGATSEWLMSANGLASNPATPPVSGWYLVATGDFNHDGITDMMWKNAATGDTSEWLMSADGGLAGNPGTPGGQGWSVVATGDFNGDGVQDLMWQNVLTGATSEWLMSASGGLANNPPTPGAPGWKVAAIGDLAGGSIDELMWQNGASGATSEWLMSANGGLGTNPSTPGAQGWNLAATGDFNGDGITDLMWQNATTGATSEWLMSPSGGLAGNPPTPSALGWKLVTSGDFNGDGIADLMWQNTATGATSEWLMSASGGLASNPATPTAAGIPTPMTSSAAVMTSATATEANGLSPNDAGSDLDPVRAGHSLALATVTHPAHAIADLPLV